MPSPNTVVAWTPGGYAGGIEVRSAAGTFHVRPHSVGVSRVPIGQGPALVPRSQSRQPVSQSRLAQAGGVGPGGTPGCLCAHDAGPPPPTPGPGAALVPPRFQ